MSEQKSTLKAAKAPLSPFIQQVVKDAEKAVTFVCSLVDQLKTLPPPTKLYDNGVDWSYYRYWSYIKLRFGYRGDISLELRQCGKDAVTLTNLSAEMAANLIRVRLLRMATDGPINNFNWEQLRRSALDDIQSSVDFCEAVDQALQKTVQPDEVYAFEKYQNSNIIGYWKVAWGVGEKRLAMNVCDMRNIQVKFPGLEWFLVWDVDEAADLVALHHRQLNVLK